MTVILHKVLNSFQLKDSFHIKMITIWILDEVSPFCCSLYIFVLRDWEIVTWRFVNVLAPDY